MQLPKQVVNGRFRESLSQEDIRFVISALTDSNTGAPADGLMRLLTDTSTRDSILDSPKLFDYLQTQDGPVLMSTELFFYVLLRHALLEGGIDNSPLTSYVAAVLAKPTESMTQSKGHTTLKLSSRKPFDYTNDLIEALNHTKGYDWFCLATAIADQSLLLTGIFSDLLYSRQQKRAAPGLNYYETIGKNHYHLASSHRLADEFELKEILCALSENFSEVRAILNTVREKYLCLGE